MSTPSKQKENRPVGWTPPDFKDRVAIVAGASRGAGRGIALALAETGATVYVTGRTTRGGLKPFDGAPGTIDDTAEEVTRRGGRGIPVRCDHTMNSDVEALFERVRREHGRLDILANAVWDFNTMAVQKEWKKQPVWELAGRCWQEAMVAGPYAHLVAALHAARVMASRRRGLIVSVTEPILEKYDRGGSLPWMFHILAHRGINRIAEAMSTDLVKHKIAIVALAPGFMRTERVLMHMKSMTEKQKRA